MRGVRPHGPYLRDGLLAAGVFAAMLGCAMYLTGEAGDSVGALGVLSAAGASAPLAFRTRAPCAVLVLVTIAIFPAMETLDGSPTVALAPIVALYTVAVEAQRRVAVAAAVVMIPIALLFTALFAPHGFFQVETLKNVAFVVAPFFVGISVRDRRAYVQAMRDRAERAEATREEEALRRVDEERLRIAREVHDVVAHSMVAINVQAGVAAHLVERRPEAAHTALAEIKRASGEALADLRATLGVLREREAPAPTRPAPGLGAIDELAGPLRAAGVEVHVSDGTAGDVLPSAVEAVAFRIVQEALTNVLRHAPDAARADVRLAVGAGALEVEVVDDGRGAAANGDGNRDGSGHGLHGMRERATAVGGAVAAGRRAGGGWRVHARLPLRTPAAATP